MKKILYILAMAAVMLTSCTKEPKQEVKLGTVSFDLTYSGDYITKASSVNVADFKVSITREDGWSKTYDRYADVPTALELAEGEYTVTATSAGDKLAAFDQPIYGGSQNFSIIVGEVTPVSVSCTLTNMKISFVTTENFRNELSDFTVTVTNASTWTAEDASERTLIWDREAIEQNKAGYFTVAPIMIKVDAYRAIDNSETHAELSVSNVAAQDYHIVTLDAKVTGQVNSLNITIDDSMNEKNDNIFIPGWDETPVDGGNDSGEEGGDNGEGEGEDQPSADAPTMSWEANPEFTNTPITNPMNVDILISAPKMIKTFVVSVDSEVLSPVIAALAEQPSYDYFADGPFDMDLINDPVMVAALDGMGIGIPTGDAIYNQTSVNFSLSSLIPMIMLYSPAPGSEHVFTLKVTDQEGQTLEKTLTFFVPEA
ncbi:MAG: DUF4493 domain-containing protein [Bacteroidales bacterium]|nr:DUF4493 domain-containing protein [Bacteroidales bacterium]